MNFIGIDIGGSWIKGTIMNGHSTDKIESHSNVGYMDDFQIKKVKSPLSEFTECSTFIDTLKNLISELSHGNGKIEGIGISTAGIVNYEGSRVLKAGKHLNILKSHKWKQEVESALQCPTVLINDADAAAIGICEKGLLKGNKSVGIMPVGTGIGFSIWRNGRRWRPGKSLSLLGSIRTPSGPYNELGSASKLASLSQKHNLTDIFTQDEYKSIREEYLNNLEQIINTSAIIYNLDEIMICGGLADAVDAANYSLEKELNTRLSHHPVELNTAIKVSVLKGGNRMQLIGAISLAKGEYTAQKLQLKTDYHSIFSEKPYQKTLQLQKLSTPEIIQTLYQAEVEAGKNLTHSLDKISKISDEISQRINKGGRLIYIGSGTSGRIAAMDAVEIPCTYGFPEEKIICLIAGGISDAAIEIESDFEEDASSVPELLLLNIQKNDCVIGISASGTAYYVQSGLAVAKERGAYSVMVQSEKPAGELPFCNEYIPLNSGFEVVAGSTRMKAGTATKKVLNFISTSVMIKLGKVAGSYMIDVACINKKLIERAQSILNILFNLHEDEALKILKASNMDLKKAIEDLKKL